jgi:hypothetical protein
MDLRYQWILFLVQLLVVFILITVPLWGLSSIFFSFAFLPETNPASGEA